MDEDKAPDLDTSLSIAAQARLDKLHYGKELRGLELRAYSGVLEALRASGKPNQEKEGLIKTLREYFDISEERHKSEIRLMAFDSNLSLISKKLHGYDYTEEWAFQAQHMYVPLGSQAFSVYKNPPGSSKRPVIRDPIPSGRLQDVEDSTDDESLSESELELIENFIQTSITNGWYPGKHKVLSNPVAVDPGTGNEKEIEEIEQMKRNSKGSTRKQQQSQPKSPDITEALRTPIKSIEKEEKLPTTTPNPGKSRGMKRKKVEIDETPPPTTVPTTPAENSTNITAKKVIAEKSRSIIKIKKSSRSKPKIKIHSRRPESKKVKESSEETSSADEGENGPMPPEESSRVMSPVFSEVIRTSVLARGSRGRAYSRSRNSIDRRKNNVANSSSTKGGKSRPRTPNQKSSKFKTSTPSSGSRRKSKLNEKIDYDEVLMDLDGNEIGRQRLPPQAPTTDDRRHLFDNQGYDREDYKTSEDCAVYTESLPVNYNHEDMEQVTDGVFKRPLPPSKGPKPWEIKDARLNHYHQSQRNESVGDENTDGHVNPLSNEGVQQQRFIQVFSPPQNNNLNDLVPPTTPPKLTEPPPSKKQRIKSPLVVNPNINSSTNVAKVPLTTPVFSTSLNPVNKKRNNNNNSSKPISVVDSLNLHLPTSATASSLAASSNNRRPGTATGGGCSMFSNSSALIAGARGTAPGILQQQRKAQPHILSNSKVQRSFLPVVNSNIATNSVVSNVVPIGTPVTISSPPSSMSAPVVAAGHSVQLSTSPIPISAISAANPTSSLPFQTFPCAPSSLSPMNIGPGIPLGHVSRSATGTNIIFVQKANGPAVSGAAELPSNVIPIKTQPRAVILRRAQLPRQGNVMILDMQKNQFVSPAPGQTPPFLQATRVLNSPAGELSLVNIQPSTSIRKNSPPVSLSLSTTTTQVLNNISSTQAPHHIGQLQIQASGGAPLHVSNPEAYITIAGTSHIAQMSTSIINTPVQITTTTAQQGNTQETESIPPPIPEPSNSEVVTEDGNQDAQYAQIEAELMQMEEGNFGEVVYEEEVTTEIVPLEDNENTQYIYTNESCANADGEVFLVPQEPLSHHHTLSTSGSSTDTAPESETNLQNFDSSENDINRTKVTLSPAGEVKMASEAISRALSLSKSSAKRLTFTTPISLSTAATIAENLANSNKNSTGADTMVTANSTQISIVPSIFQTTTSELNPTAVVIEADPSSTNSVHIGNSQPGIEFTLHNNEILQQP